MTDHDHAHEHDESEEVDGVVFGFRLFEEGGQMYLAEAEIFPGEDEPSALGVTLVFQPLSGLDLSSPPEEDEEDDEPASFDFDDELTRDPKAPVAEQIADIVRQLSNLTPASLAEYLRAAREDES